jgi:hypothetical protein
MSKYRQHPYTSDRVNARRQAANDLLAVLIMAMAIFVPFYLWSM